MKIDICKFLLVNEQVLRQENFLIDIDKRKNRIIYQFEKLVTGLARNYVWLALSKDYHGAEHIYKEKHQTIYL